MSEKEMNKTRSQFQRCYSLLKRTDLKTFHLHLGNLEESSQLYQTFLQKTDGFENMSITVFPGSVFEEFPPSKLVYLSPDAAEPLLTIAPDRVYVIGGLVDDNIKRGATRGRCERAGVRTARLPIQEYWERPNHKQCVLTINQVFKILLLVHNGAMWREVLEKVMPKRKGLALGG